MDQVLIEQTCLVFELERWGWRWWSSSNELEVTRDERLDTSLPLLKWCDYTSYQHRNVQTHTLSLSLSLALSPVHCIMTWQPWLIGKKIDKAEQNQSGSRCVCVCACVRVRVWVLACVHARVSACVCVCDRMRKSKIGVIHTMWCKWSTHVR